MHGKNIIITGLQNFDLGLGSNCKNIAFEFAKKNKVLYVNPPVDIATQLKSVIKRNPNPDSYSGLRKISENLFVFSPFIRLNSVNWIKHPALFDFFNRKNNSKFADDIKKAAAKIGFDEFILFIDGDMFRSFYLKDLLKPSLSIYYLRDYYLGVPYWKTHGSRLEPELMKKSDLIFTNSEYLAEYSVKYNRLAKNTGQGCDIPRNYKARKPSEFKSIKTPVIGYTGALKSLRLDLKLLEDVAEAKREWTFVFVGPEDKEFAQSRLHSLPNVHFTGKKDPEKMYDYISAFDVCINPQAVNDVTKGNYPRKIDEYLLMGKPVVATKTPAMEMFREHVYLANGKDEYIKMITMALLNKELAKDKRKKFASAHTWSNSIKIMYDSIKKYSENAYNNVSFAG